MNLHLVPNAKEKLEKDIQEIKNISHKLNFSDSILEFLEEYLEWSEENEQ